MLEFGTGVFGEATRFDSMFLVPASAALAPFPGGGALSVFRAEGGVMAERWDREMGTWESAGLLFPGAPDIALATNASGAAIAIAYTSKPSEPTPLSVLGFDGTSWSQPESRSFPPVYSLVRLGMLPDGAGLLVWSQGQSIRAMRLRSPGEPGSHFLAVETLHTAAEHEVLLPPELVVDAQGRVTVAWVGDGYPESTAYALRDLGTGWGTVQTLGPSATVALVLDASSDVLALTIDGLGGKLGLQRVAASATTWTSPSQTGLALAGGSGTLNGTASVAFAADGAAVVFAKQDRPRLSPSDLGLGVYSATCK